LNQDFEQLNERTMGAISPVDEDEPIPTAYAGLLEENYVEGVDLMRRMVDDAPGGIQAGLAAYVKAIAKLWEMYAEYDYDQAATWENADYETFFADYAVPDAVRARTGEWFVENCGIDLQG